MPSHVPGCIAATAATGFAGAALYASVVQHPAALESGVKAYKAFFGPMFKRAAPFQASLAAVAGLSAVAQASQSALPTKIKAAWLASGLLLGGIIPYTLVAMMPTNNKIIAGSTSEDDSAVTEEDFVLWGKLHAVRTAASIAGLGVMIWALSRQK